jgi:SAM-dependent methyltransferase
MARERIRDYYEALPESDRLKAHAGRLECLRSREILRRVLPPAPARILDVGGATGEYSFWLAEMGYEVRLVDLSPRHVELAAARNAMAAGKLAGITVGDATRLDFEDSLFDGVLLMGPMYHIIDRAGRVAALREAARVLRPSGVAVTAYISRFASLIDGYRNDLFKDTVYTDIVRRDIGTGIHLPPHGRNDYFTEAYFHHPSEIEGELTDAGFEKARVLSVEGFAWMLTDLDARLDDNSERALLFEWLDRIQEEASLLGVSGHLLAVSSARALD